MISKKGADYMDADEETVVEDFVDSMRRFNTNIVATAGEARFINKADDETKTIAKEAYELYDSLGNVFVNDGVFGAVDGVKIKDIIGGMLANEVARGDLTNPLFYYKILFS